MKGQLLKINQALIFFVLLTVVLFYGQPLLVPLFFAILLAMLMAPVCRRLDKRGLHRAVSCLICVFILLVVFLSMLGIMVGQVSSFVSEMSEVELRASELLLSAQGYIEKRFNISMAEQTAFIQKETQNLGESLRGYLSGVLRSTIQLLVGLIITLVITFLLLFHKEKYNAFFLKITRGDTEEKRAAMLDRISLVAQNYLVGRAISIIVLFVLYVLALIIIGVDNALLLGAVAALFNIIPYLGPILAAVFPVLVALVSEPTVQPAIWVLISFCLFQALDNYFVTPYFLGGEVSLSALSTIVGMIVGGFLWGVAGMILFIPMLSIAKIVFDHVPGLEPYGELIGDEGERPTKNINAWLRRVFGRGVKEKKS
jgi:predicted PurR-regulated permease PerM